MASSFGSSARGGALKAPALAIFVAALFVSAPAGAKRKKAKPPPPPDAAAQPATPEPAPDAAPVKSPAAAPHEELEPVTGPALTVVGLAMDPTRDREAALDAFLGEQAVRRARKQPLSALSDLLDPTGAAAREKAASDGKRALEAARKAYFNDLDLDTAGALCDRAYGLFLKSDLPQHFEELVQSSELKIASLAADPTKGERVRTELSLLLPIDPRSELSPNLFNPDVMKLAEGLRAQLKAQSNLTLDVKTGSVPARIFIDGLFRGIAPLTVAHLAPGNHLLTVVAPGYARVQRKVNPGPEPAVELALEPAEGASAARPRIDALKRVFLSSALPQSLAELAHALQVEQVLLLAAEAGPTPNSAQLAAVRAGGTALKPALLADLDAPLPDDELKRVSVVDQLATQAVSADHQLHGHRVLLEGSGGGRGARIAGYSLIGTGVVAGGAGTLFGLKAKSAQNDYRNQIQNSSAASDLKSAGQRDALIANVAFGAAVVAVGVGVALVLTHPAGKAEDASEEAAPSPEPSRRASPHPPETPRAAEPRKSEPAKSTEPRKSEPSKPAEPRKAEPSRSSEPRKPEPSKPAEPKKSEPTKSSEPKKAEPAPVDDRASTAAPDAGPAEPKKPPRDLGEDIKE